MSKNNLVKRLKEQYTSCNALINEMTTELNKYTRNNKNSFRIQYNSRNDCLKITVYHNKGLINHNEAYRFMNKIEAFYGFFDNVVFDKDRIYAEYNMTSE